MQIVWSRHLLDEIWSGFYSLPSDCKGNVAQINCPLWFADGQSTLLCKATPTTHATSSVAVDPRTRESRLQVSPGKDKKKPMNVVEASTIERQWWEENRIEVLTGVFVVIFPEDLLYTSIKYFTLQYHSITYTTLTIFLFRKKFLNIELDIFKGIVRISFKINSYTLLILKFIVNSIFKAVAPVGKLVFKVV